MYAYACTSTNTKFNLVLESTIYHSTGRRWMGLPVHVVHVPRYLGTDTCTTAVGPINYGTVLSTDRCT